MSKVKLLLSLLALVLIQNLKANISHVQLDQIPFAEEYKTEIKYLLQHVKYLDHYELKWPYEIDKEELSQEIKKIHSTFSNEGRSHLEFTLLLGIVGHYLHNLDHTDYFSKAVSDFQKAIELAPKDYRPHWFLGAHYAKGNNQQKSITYLFQAVDILPDSTPGAFWEDYVFATYIAGMPSHALYGMEMAKKAMGKPSQYDQVLSQTFASQKRTTHKDSTYAFKELWRANEIGNDIQFDNRSLGLQLIIDKGWRVQMFDYENQHTFVTIEPEAIENEAGTAISYTIMIMFKVPNESDKIEDFVGGIIKEYPVVNTMTAPPKYQDAYATELKDPKMYSDIGGAHMQVIGIERNEPDYPGMKLEAPREIKSSGSEMAFFKTKNFRDRFKGRLFYTIMLDTCEDIYPEAAALFQKFIEKRLVIE